MPEGGTTEGTKAEQDGGPCGRVFPANLLRYRLPKPRSEPFPAEFRFTSSLTMD